MHDKMYEKKYEMLMEDFWDELNDGERYITQADMMKDHCKTYADNMYAMAQSRIDNAKKIKVLIDDMIMRKATAVTPEVETTQTKEDCKMHYTKEVGKLNKYVTKVSTMLAMAKM